PVWALGVWLLTRLGLRTWFCLAMVVALPAGVALGVVPVRYGIPIAASRVQLLPLRARAAHWHLLVAPVAALMLFLVSAQWDRQDQLVADYDCLLEEIGRREIATVATDHWNAKPLYFAAKAAGREIGIVQIRF